MLSHHVCLPPLFILWLPVLVVISPLLNGVFPFFLLIGVFLVLGFLVVV